MKTLYSFDRKANILLILLSFLITQLVQAQVDCSSLPVWTSSGVYTGDTRVQYNNVAYEANWWTQNENPASNSGQWQVWTSLGTCGTGGGNSAPTVSINTTGTSFTEGENITISASASDSDGTVASVSFYQNGSLLGTDSSSPFSYSWTNVAAGNYSLTATATDNDGASTTSSTLAITVQSDNTGGGGDCEGTASYVENGGYSPGSEVSNNGNIYQCRDYPNSGWCNGSAWAYEPGTGAHWQDAWTLVSECGGGTGGDNLAPDVSITSPSNGASVTPGSTVNIEASASDSDGSVTKVAFYQNGNLLGEDTSAPYTYSWTSVAIGSYAITAIATDNESATTTSSQVYINVSDGGNPNTALPDRVMVGYWHNFDNGSGVVKLRDVSDKWDVINIAFAEPTTQGGASMTFTPDNAIYSSTQEFKNDVAYLKSQGKKVLISIGGANGTIHIENAANAQSFSSTMINIINEYGFDGLDIDLEGSSLSLGAGDTDFRFPASPRVVYFIQGMETILNNYGSDFVLTAAPETAYVQGGYSTYGGIFGAYLPVLYALKDRMALIHVQHYNTGCMLGLDNQCYSQGTADFQVAMGEMLLQGFSVAGNPTAFPPFREDQLAIGLPASPSAAGGGYTNPNTVKQALDYLIKGISYGGNYTLINSGGYSGFRGMMTWSINWDINFGYEFSNNYRAYLDALPSSRWTLGTTQKDLGLHDGLTIGPNPFVNQVKLTLTVSEEREIYLGLYNQLGQEIKVLRKGITAKGIHESMFNTSELNTGMYFIRMIDGEKSETFKLLKE
ncbi:Ig-like domain-containing protein [Marinoscillum pacificum]|uniref:Ig-like domain-containing protein n=1 Tax=Marinoscillum pacificum TaxID=392723 RepID=UPI00280B5ADD|nr:Ig-like domain-containing protein [Marinoscillum pacificum]